jgi:phosphoglycolate phosphatase-like HAD superfamily hydrolase
MSEETSYVDTYIFDLDGTLLNNRDCFYAAVEYTLFDLGVPFSELECVQNWGKPSEEFWRALGVPEHVSAEEADSRFIDEFKEYRPFTCYRDTGEMLVSLKTLGKRLAVVTGSDSDLIDAFLVTPAADRLFMEDLFDYVLPGCRDRESNLKQIIEMGAMSPETTAYVDDSPRGIRIGNGLGMLTIGRMNGFAASRDIVMAEPNETITESWQLVQIAERYN